MKKVGGPTMNDTPWDSISSSAASGDHFAINTVVIPAAAGTRMPLSRPDTWANGAGISTTSRSVIPWTSAMLAAL